MGKRIEHEGGLRYAMDHGDYRVDRHARFEIVHAAEHDVDLAAAETAMSESRANRITLEERNSTD